MASIGSIGNVTIMELRESLIFLNYLLYLLMVIFKGTWEYLTTISGGLKYLNEEIYFRKNNHHHLTPHVQISHIPHI